MEDKELGYYFDFNQNNENTFSAANFEYKFDICDGVQDITECEGSAICGKNKENGNWESFGKIDQMTVLKPFEMVMPTDGPTEGQTHRRIFVDSN